MVSRRQHSVISNLTIGALCAKHGTGIDPTFSNNILLLHMEGSNGGTSFIDQMGHTMTRNSNPVTSTAQAKFGSTSMKLTRSGPDYLYVHAPTDMALGTGDFTLECFIYPTSLVFYETIFDFSPQSTTPGAYPLLYFDASGAFIYYVLGATRITSAAVVVANAWKHVALSRTSGTTELFYDGNRVGTWADSTNYLNNGAALGPRIGADAGGAGDGSNFDGYIDEVRWKKGVSIYSGATLTVPTAPFPDS